MTKQIVVIHGGEAFEKYEDYLKHLKQKELSLDRLKFKDWKRSLGEALGMEYEVLLPQMPNSQNARYLEWQIWFEKIIPFLNDSVILVGHSLGGIFSKVSFRKPISQKNNCHFVSSCTLQYRS